MLPLLVEASPQFEGICDAFFNEWKEEGDAPPYYVALGEFARFIVDKLERGDTSNFPSLFQVIERLLLNGDSYVREATTVGLLENIQNILGNKNREPQAMVAFLLPETLLWWNRVNEFWDGGRLLSEE